ncbi:MAG: CRISPR-associated protein Cas4 [candidate division KSB1 bacterium]|nr:CRISPR-associated protein Cas4 [candidate division KSB1 bacterium]MDZ7274605.1 CRISPR-associated protein Cas4 [candidate division KSB1 bacterium]MDZ7285430.1 CRISPR-associated protein Cas4 [candidate division KSB1 bacterium]MDZ7298462.1 CRISPR-associated protein Cas4 [candidate division KSB1 bacterium]MDZ7306946.1 CRISPR-associated protein Cas4 [candidate division KSB1 bacterium]
MESLNHEPVTLTPSEVLEYLFCPRYIYFMNVLGIPQREEKRYKVLRGREVHREKQIRNRAYLRKKLGVLKREFNVYLSAPRHHLRGQIDEVLTLADGSMAPLDYKFAEWKERLYRGYRTQLVLYGLLIQENYGKPVNRGFLVYTRSQNHVVAVEITPQDYKKAVEILRAILDITRHGFLPRRTTAKNRCLDCCYKNICV